MERDPPERASDLVFLGSPYGIRTRAATLRGWCPRPLDERAELRSVTIAARRSNRPGVTGNDDNRHTRDRPDEPGSRAGEQGIEP